MGAVEQRSLAQLTNYHLDIEYRPRQENVNADVPSKMPYQVQLQDPTSLQTTLEPAYVVVVREDRDPEHWKH